MLNGQYNLLTYLDVQQQRKFLKKSSGDFFSANDQWPTSVKALLHRELLLAQR